MQSCGRANAAFTLQHLKSPSGLEWAEQRSTFRSAESAQLCSFSPVCCVFIPFNNWGICSLLTSHESRRVIWLIIANSLSQEVWSSLRKCRVEIGAAFGSDLVGLIYFEMIYTAASSTTAVDISSALVSHRLSSSWEWVKFILPSTVHMWLKYTRAVSIEAETVGERQKKDVLWSGGMREENKNEGNHSRLQKAFSNGGFTPFKNTSGVTLIPLLSSKQPCNQDLYQLTIIKVLSAW